MTRIVLADDHAILRQGLRQILLTQPDFEVSGEVANHGEVMQLVRRDCPDVLVLDINMPGKNGIETLKQVKQEVPRLPVLILSMYSEDQYAVRALKAGASGYLTKMAAADQLVEAIRVIAAGRKYITPQLAQSLADGFDRDAERAPHEALSDREFQVLRMIAAGHSLVDIGRELALSPKTVGAYRSRLLEKLRLATNVELTRYALEHNLID